MSKPVKIVIETHLDSETVKEIELMRSMRLEHYKMVIANPEASLAALKRHGLQEEVSLEELKDNARAQIEEIETRLMEPDMIFEEELTLYVDTLSLEA